MSVIVTTEAVLEMLDTERRFLLDRLAEVCPDHQRCMECGGPLCEACKVGGTTSRCPHGDPICSACDPTERCGDCWVEQRDRVTPSTQWSDPPFVICPVCSGAGAIQHPSRNPELIEDCGRCGGDGEVRAA